MCIAETSVQGHVAIVVIVAGGSAAIHGQPAALHGQAASLHAVAGCSAAVPIQKAMLMPPLCMFS